MEIPIDLERHLRVNHSTHSSDGEEVRFTNICCPLCHAHIRPLSANTHMFILSCDTPNCRPGLIYYHKNILQDRLNGTLNPSSNKKVPSTLQYIMIVLMRFLFRYSYSYPSFGSEHDESLKYIRSKLEAIQWEGSQWASAYFGLSYPSALELTSQRFGAAKVIAVDSDTSAISKLRKVFAKNPIISNTLAVNCGHDQTLFSKSSLCCVVSNLALHESKNFELDIIESSRILAEGGTLICTSLVTSNTIVGRLFSWVSRLAGYNPPNVDDLVASLNRTGLVVEDIQKKGNFAMFVATKKKAQ